MMFAVVKTGSKQYRVCVGDRLRVEKLSGSEGDLAILDNVLMLGDKVGKPQIAGASVAARILEQARDDKIIVFKKRRRKASQRTIGHRQHYSLIEVTEFLEGGAKPSRTAPPAKKVDTKKATTEKSTAKKATTKKVTAKKPTAAKSTTKKPTTKKPTAKKAVVKKKESKDGS